MAAERMTAERIRVAVIADTHFHLDADDPHVAYPSDAEHNAQNEALVQVLLRLDPALVLHLGDVPHPVPGVPEHEGALAVAHRTLGPLGDRLHVVPGNHDVGDKPHAHTLAPGVSVPRHGVFERVWGPPWRSLRRAGWRMLLLDTPVLGSGLELESEQEAWIEAELAGAAANGEKVLWFQHYPPYVHLPDEPTHYDNLDQPARGRWLARWAVHRVRAVFCGHVHFFFWDRQGPTDLWILPATSFVRPEYAELARVEPGPEFGRAERAKLGFFVLHLDARLPSPEDVQVETVRGFPLPSTAVHPDVAPGAGPTPASPLGVTLRHAWDHAEDVPCGNLDEHVRKLARPDWGIQALLALGVSRPRVPLGDLAVPHRRDRMLRLADAFGWQWTVWSVGRPSPDELAAVRAFPALEAWEVVAPWGLRTVLAEEVSGLGPPVFLSVVGGKAERGPAPVGAWSHFHPHGWNVDERPELPDGLGAVVRCGGGVLAVVHELAERPHPCRLVVETPRAGEGTAATDDLAVARLAASALLASLAVPSVAVALDTWIDHDRGYFPRHGLIDRRLDPRAGWRALHTLGRLLRRGRVRADGTVELDGAPWRLADEGRGVDLLTGEVGSFLGLGLAPCHVVPGADLSPPRPS